MKRFGHVLVWWWAAAACWLAPAAVLTATPAEEVRAAVADLELRVPAERWRATRYVSQYHLPRDVWESNMRLLSFVLNSVSRAAVIVRPQVVPESGGRLVRVDLADYRLEPEAWEALVSDQEPYWHVTTAVLVAGQAKDAARGAAATAQARGAAHAAADARGTTATVYTDGGWVGLAEAARLRAMTRSGGAVVRMDWFVLRAVTPPHYYNLAGIGSTAAAWYEGLGIDKRRIIELRANHGANLIYSHVTRKPRRISRYQGPLGGVWQTYDSRGDDPAKDPIRNPTFAAAFDATENIAAKANGLWAYAIFDGQGRRQDAVPAEIAHDTSDPRGDGILVPMLSCVRCHVESGLRPLANDQARLLSGRVELYAASADEAQRLAAFYLSPKLARGLERDREDYEQAVASAADATGRQIAEMLAGMVRAYSYELVTPETAAAELAGSEAAAGRPARAILAPLARSHDPILLALVEGIAVQRTQWEASFAEAALRAAAGAAEAAAAEAAAKAAAARAETAAAEAAAAEP